MRAALLRSSSGAVERVRDDARVGHLAALVCYVAVSVAFFGLPVVAHPGRAYIGHGIDPEEFVWFFAWWPHAILHWQNPIVTHAIWAPEGVNLAWATSTPGLALAFAPVMLLFGPVAAYNVASVLLPALAAWTAYLLCRRLTGALWPSLVGGYLFGFSSYMLGQEEGHLNMTSVLLVPLVALTVLRFLDAELDGRGLVWRLGALLGAQFYLSTEIFFTVSLALVVGCTLAWTFAHDRRPRLASLPRPLLGAYAVAAFIASPLLYYTLTGFESGSINLPRSFTGDLLNPVVPSSLTAIGGRWAASVSSHFAGNDAERSLYLGLPLLAIVVAFAVRRWRTPGGRFLVVALGLALLAALGPALRVGGHRLFPLPWVAVVDLPVFNNVLPARLGLYVSLVAAVIAALWTAATANPWLRAGLPGLAVLALLPHVGHGHWKTTPTRPPFFAAGLYRHCLAPGENVLVFPFRDRGDSMLWQAESRFYYRMAAGYVSAQQPVSFTRLPGSGEIDLGLVPPGGAADVLRLATSRGVTTILVQQPDDDQWRFLTAAVRPREVGSVMVFPLASQVASRKRCGAGSTDAGHS